MTLIGTPTRFTSIAISRAPFYAWDLVRFKLVARLCDQLLAPFRFLAAFDLLGKLRQR